MDQAIKRRKEVEGHLMDVGGEARTEGHGGGT